MAQLNAKTGAHHHGERETASHHKRTGADALGREAEIRGTKPAGQLHLCAALRAAPGINARRDEALGAVIVRSRQEPVVVNLDISSPEDPSEVPWTDPTHRA